MLGAIAGDVAGSRYEFHATKDHAFKLFKEASTFTDDTVLTVATAEVLLYGESFSDKYRSYHSRYPSRGYGGRFNKWAASKMSSPYNSFGNGSAMRVSPVGWAFEKEEEVIARAAESASVTHDHPEGIKGAESVAWCIWAGRKGKSKDEIRSTVSGKWKYNLNRTLDEIRPGYKFDETCQGSVPESIL